MRKLTKKGGAMRFRKTIIALTVAVVGLLAVPAMAHTSSGIVVHHGKYSFHQNKGNAICANGVTIEVNIDPGINSGIVGKKVKIRAKNYTNGSTYTWYRTITSSRNNRFIVSANVWGGIVDYTYSYIYSGWNDWDSGNYGFGTDHSMAQWCY